MQRKALLEPVGLHRCSTDGWGAHARHMDPGPHELGGAISHGINTCGAPSTPQGAQCASAGTLDVAHVVPGIRAGDTAVR